MCVCVQGRVHHMTVKEDQSRRGAREEKGGKGAIAMATAPPPLVQTSKEGGRTSNPNRQRSSGSFLKGYTQRRGRRAREGRVGRPRPSGDAPADPGPPPAHRWPQPLERPRGGSPRPLAPRTRPRRPVRPPAAKRGCVCSRRGRGPARLSPAGPAPRRPSARARTRWAASSLLTGWTAGGEGRRGVSGTARASGFLGGSVSGSELTVPGEPNS